MSDRAATLRGSVTWLGLAAAACSGPSARPRPPPCPSTPVVATSQESLDALAGCRSLPGLTIRSAAHLDLAPLAGLTAVGGELVIGPTLALDRVALPALASVDGRLAIVSGGSVGGIFLPAVTRVGDFEVRDQVALAELIVPRLAAVTGSVTIVRVPALELVDLSSLATIGGDLTVAAPQMSTWLGDAPAVAGARAVDAPALAGP